jgi:curli biogenesis system outer membrane secretion channel CsgG
LKEDAMKKLFHAVLALAVVLVAPTPLLAQAKIRIAIWDFENHAEHQWWFWNDLGPAARNQIETSLSENPTLSATFSVIEREKLDLVMKEQGLSSAGVLDPQSAAKIGRVLGVKYIVTGGIDKFTITNTRAAIGRFGVGGNVAEAEATVNMRFIDTTTGERVLSVSADGNVKKGGGFLRGTSLSRDAEWGIASETIQMASKAIVERLAAGNTLAKITGASGSTGGIDARVIKTDGNRAYINMGSSSGVKVGDKFAIFNVGEELVDPVTGAKLGAEEKQTGTGIVTDVQEKFAIMNVTGTAKAKDVIRMQR